MIGFAFLGLFDFAGPVQTFVRHRLGLSGGIDPRGYGGVVTVMTLVFYPYVYLLARAAFAEQGAATLETARSLGCDGCAPSVSSPCPWRVRPWWPGPPWP